MNDELFSTSTKCLVEIHNCLHLVEIVGNLGKLGIQQTALGLDDLQIAARTALVELLGILNILLKR